jgi:UDP-3-O-[3-hydroxymyristoyl] glucosamine N-acyltransferase
VGRNCIINTKALVEHDAIIEDHCHISTGAIVNGGGDYRSWVFCRKQLSISRVRVNTL